MLMQIGATRSSSSRGRRKERSVKNRPRMAFKVRSPGVKVKQYEPVNIEILFK